MFLLLISNHLLENEPLGSGDVPQLEATNKSKQINNPKIRFKAENKKPNVIRKPTKIGWCLRECLVAQHFSAALQKLRETEKQS